MPLAAQGYLTCLRLTCKMRPNGLVLSSVARGPKLVRLKRGLDRPPTRGSGESQQISRTRCAAKSLTRLNTSILRNRQRNMNPRCEKSSEPVPNQRARSIEKDVVDIKRFVRVSIDKR